MVRLCCGLFMPRMRSNHVGSHLGAAKGRTTGTSQCCCGLVKGKLADRAGWKEVRWVGLVRVMVGYYGCGSNQLGVSGVIL